MLYRQGFTLIEIIVVLILIGVMVAFAFPDFYSSQERARALNVQNNLLTIYSAEQNYFNNNNGNYCLSTAAPLCDNIVDINTSLSLNIQDDGKFTYQCGGANPTFFCLATDGTISLTLFLGQSIALNGGGNPVCAPAGKLCP